VSSTVNGVSGEARDVTAGRLLKLSRAHSYDPDAEIDWAAAQEPDMFYLPERLVSLYGTPLWERMSRRQRIELSRLGDGFGGQLGNLAGEHAHTDADAPCLSNGSHPRACGLCAY
jgi:hypothetical protein